MSLVSLAMNLFLAGLLMAALAMGWRLNRRLKTLRESHEGFAVAVRELNTAAARAEQGLADLRAATDEAVDLLADRIEKGRALAAKLEKLTQDAPAAPRREPVLDPDLAQERRLGALLAAAREARARPERLTQREPIARPKPAFEDDLFDDPAPEPNLRGARR